MHQHLRIPTCLTVASVLMAAGLPTALGQVEWRTGTSQAAPMDAAQLVQAMTDLGATGSHGVMQLARPIDDDERAMLDAAGVNLLAPLGNHAYFYSLDENAVPAQAAAVAPMVSVTGIDVDWKRHPTFVAGNVPAWTIVEPGPDPIVAIYVIYHRDVALDGALLDVPQFGGVVVDEMDVINGAVVELPYSQVVALAASDDVQWVEPALPKFSPTNAENRAITQVNELQEAPYGLDGTGVTALVYDAGRASTTHSDFSGRLSILPGDTAGLSGHATHVAGTVGGDGSVTFNNRGMATNVDILSAGFQWTGDGVFLYENPGDIEMDYGTAIGLGASVANNSIGTNTENNGFDCAIQGDYGITSALIDEIARGGLGAPITIVWSNGNERGGSTCDIEGYGDYYSTAPPAGAKNHITIGALNSNDDSMTSFSSWGPVDDGRMKPDISGPGCQSDGDGGVTSCATNGGYSVLCGTSMSAPTVTGITALLLQDFRAHFPDLEDPIGSTVKAMLAHTCEDLGNVGPDYQFGYGSVRAKDLIDFMRTGQFAEIEISQGDVHAFEFEVTDEAELRYTLAWPDVPGTPNVDPALVNQLDLRLVDPDGQVHHPWVLDPFNPDDPATQDGPNVRDNIEQVYVADPIPGTWSVQVAGTDVAEGPQLYSLVGSPGMNVTLLSIGLPAGVPDLVAPGESVELDVTITPINETLIEGTEKIYYRFADGAYTEADLTPNGETYLATIPSADCGALPEFYLSAEGKVNGIVYNPADGPDAPHDYDIGAVEVFLTQDFEIDDGWSVENLGATTGDWQRGVPVDDPLWDYDPATDADGSGQCFLTQNELGNTDVDNGAVRLTSPYYDMSEGKASITYDYYLYLTANADMADQMLVEVDTGDGEWTAVASHTDNGLLEWRTHVIDPDTLDAAGVAPTDTTRLRFTVNDDGEQNVLEAGVDHLVISAVVCEASCYADFNGDGTLNILDFVDFQLAFQAGDDAADCDANGSLDVLDFVCFQVSFQKGCN